MNTKLDKAARLKELLEQIDGALIECRKIAREETGGRVSDGDWDWALRACDHLFGNCNPTMLRTIERLEAEAAQEAKQAA